jgi:hypothetical protein
MQSQGRPVRFGVSEGWISSGLINNYSIEEWLGYDGLKPERTVRFQFGLGTDVWEKMEKINAIEYYLHDPDPELEPRFPLEDMLANGALELVTTLNKLEVYRNIRAFPRVYLVGGARTIPDRDAMFEVMLSDGYEPAHSVLVERIPSNNLPETLEESVGSARVVDYRRTRIEIEVEADRDAVLVMADAYYPGWRAAVDGESAEIFPAYYLYRAILVPAGQHTVVFSYFPATLWSGLLVATVTMVLVNGIGVYLLIQRRRRNRAGY